jgi:hypothetical protein
MKKNKQKILEIDPDTAQQILLMCIEADFKAIKKIEKQTQPDFDTSVSECFKSVYYYYTGVILK